MRGVDIVLKKIGLILLCCILFISCEKRPPDLEPKYLGQCGSAAYISVEDYLVPEDFIHEDMAKDIKKVLKKHKVKDGPIDEDTALDIAILVVKHHYREDFFQKRTVYRISPNSDDGVFWLLISQEVDRHGTEDPSIHMIAIHQMSGEVVAYQVTDDPR